MIVESLTDSGHSPQTTQVIQNHILPNRPVLEIFPVSRFYPKILCQGGIVEFYQ